jgi:putative PIN family toxin of toxin-antitoxin system
MASVQTTSDEVFLDASVLLSATLSTTGAGRELLRLAFRKQLTLSVSPTVLSETERNLRKKAPAKLAAFQRLQAILPARVVKPSRQLVARAAQVVALKDAPIVAGAVKAKARYLATYDQRHLLRQRGSVKERFGVVVARPDEILAVLRKRQRENFP